MIIKLEPIGIVHSSLKKGNKAPVQSIFSDIDGTIEIYEKYVEGLKDIGQFEYIHCICYLDQIKPPVRLQSQTHWDNDLHGIFAIRSPWRPNPIGLSILKLKRVKNNILHVSNLDLFDRTPILDLKPFIPAIDNRNTNKIGWIKGKL